MAKKRNNHKKKLDTAAMDVSAEAQTSESQPMDTSETKVAPALAASSRKIRKGVPIRRAKNLRKQKAMERAISIDEKLSERTSRNKDKLSRIQSAKALYD